jgi:hypothetical protein
MFPVEALKYDNTVWPSICRTLISPTASGHSGVGRFPQPPSAPGRPDHACQALRSVKSCGLDRYNSTGWLRSKSLATTYTHPRSESGVGIGS